jgi:hypothetical protein
MDFGGLDGLYLMNVFYVPLQNVLLRNLIPDGKVGPNEIRLSHEAVLMSVLGG